MAANAGVPVVAPPNPFSKSEQARLLADSRERVKQYGFLMKRSVDAGDTKEALKNAAILIAELRTGLLTPKVYYELYMDVFAHMGFLEMYFSTLQRAGTPVSEIYEMVQHTGNVLVRLYLMITAGSVYIKSGQAASKDVLFDLLEMARGVQHPLRGLFLRYYLAGAMKDKLPDLASAYEGVGGTLLDAINFCIVNFGEMNRLWVRMQHSTAGGGGGPGKNKKRRERERQELRILVGGNFDRLSSLNGLDARIYAEHVLPRLLEEIVACKDRIAQPFLMECLIQAFPIEYTHACLPAVLEAITKLVPDHAVMRDVLKALIGRLKDEAQAATSAAASAGGAGVAAGAGDNRIAGLPESPPIFVMLMTAVSGVTGNPSGPFRAGSSFAAPDAAGDGEKGAASSSSAPGSSSLSAAALSESIAAALEVFASLLAFTLACHPKHLPYVDGVMKEAAGYLTAALGGQGGAADASKAGASASGEVSTAAQTAAVRASTRSAMSRLTGGEGAEGAAEGDGSASAAEAASTKPALDAATSAPAALAHTLDPECARAVVSLLSLVQADLGLSVLSLDHYTTLMGVLALAYKRQVARQLLTSVLAAGVRVSVPETARRLCLNLGPLLKDEDGSDAAAASFSSAAGSASGGSGAVGGAGVGSSSSSSGTVSVGADGTLFSEQQFIADQQAVAKLVLLLGGTTDASVAAAIAQASAVEGAAKPAVAPDADTDTHFAVLTVAREYLSHGGARRIGITFSPLVETALQLSRRIRAKDAAGLPRGRTTLKKVLQFVHETCSALAATHAELALRLFLQCALAAEGSGFASEFFSQAFLICEDITDSRIQQRCLTQIITSLQSCTGIDLENYETLCARSTQLYKKLLRKTDQVKHLLLCARLFWRGPVSGEEEERYERPREVLEILQRTLKIADSVMPAQPSLFVDILDSYVFFFEKKCPTVQAIHLTDLLSLCREQSEAMRAGSEREEVAAHFRNIVAHIQGVKAGSQRELAALYEPVKAAAS